jgi:hypothetical protein
MATLGKVGYIDVNTTMHKVSPAYTGEYTSYTARSNITGINMEDCTRAVPLVRYGDQLMLVNKELYGSVNSSSLLEMGTSTTNLFLRPPVGMDLQGKPVQYGDQVSITSSASSYTSDCGWWGCKVGRVNPTTQQFEFGPGGEAASTFRIDPPPGTNYALGSAIKYNDPFSFSATISKTNNSLDQDAYLSPGESITSANGKYMFIYQTDGNVCLYNTSGGGSIWCSMEVHTPGKLILQNDGNLVAYDSGGIPKWSTNTQGQGVSPYLLTLRNDRTVALTDTNNTVLWSTQTNLDSAASNPTISGIAYVKNSIVTFGTWKTGKSSNIFSFKSQTSAPITCNVSDLKKACDQSDCTGFLHSPANNTWQMITPTSPETDYAITNTLQDVYLKNTTVDLQDTSCVAGTTQFIDSTLFSNYVQGDDFMNGGTSQCEVIDPPKIPITYKLQQKKMMRQGKEIVQKFNNLSVSEVQDQNVQMQQTMKQKTDEYETVLNQVKKTTKSSTLEQQNVDMTIFDDYNKNHAIVWGILATLILAFILFRPKT